MAKEVDLTKVKHLITLTAWAHWLRRRLAAREARFSSCVSSPKTVPVFLLCFVEGARRAVLGGPHLWCRESCWSCLAAWLLTSCLLHWQFLLLQVPGTFVSTGLIEL